MKLRYARFLGNKYSAQVAELFGRQDQNFQYRVGNLGGGAAAMANHQSGVLTFDRDFLKNASKQDLRGNVIHELTHLFGVGDKSGNAQRIENLADYARYVLNPKEDAGWNPSAGVLRIAEKRGGPMANNTGPQLPGLGTGGGRKRQTLANMMSHTNMDFGGGPKNKGGSAALPSLSPAETANYYSQLSGLYSQYQLTRSSLKAQRVGLRADFRDAKSAAQQNMITGLADVENSAIERGITGSSADLQNRAGVKGQMAAEIAQARRTELTGRADTRLAGQQAAIEFSQGAAGLEANKLATQQERLAQQLEQNLIISGQEAQMDALKQMYQSIMGGIGDGAGGRGVKNKRRGQQMTYGMSDVSSAENLKELQKYFAQLAKGGKVKPIWQTGGGF